MVNCNEGYAQVAEVYRSGKKTRTEYLDADEKLVIGPEGFAALEREYDEAGNVICEKYFDTENKATANMNGYGEIQREYNVKKEVVYEAWFDTEGQPKCVNGDVCYVVRRI